MANLHPTTLITATVILGVWLLLNFTMLGRGIYALGGARGATERAGFNVASIKYFISVFGGLVPGIDGMTLGFSLAMLAVHYVLFVFLAWWGFARREVI